MPLPLLCISGPSGSGKSALTDAFVKNHNAVSVAFADPIKRFCKKLFDLSDDQLWTKKKEDVDERYLVVPQPELSFQEMMANNFQKPTDNSPWGLIKKKVHSHDRQMNCGCCRYSGIGRIYPDHDVKVWLEEVCGSNLEKSSQALYSWSNNFYHLCEKEKFTPRKLYQSFGEDFGRKFDPNLWARYAVQNIAFKLFEGGYRYSADTGLVSDPSAPPASLVVISDCRYVNEALCALKAGAKLVKIDCPQVKELSSGLKNHVSERQYKAIPSTFFDATVINSKTFGLMSLDKKAKTLFNSFFAGL